VSYINAIGMYEEKVGATYVVAATAHELADAVAKVKDGEPLMAARMRIARGSKVIGEVLSVDRESRTARLRWLEPTDDGRAIRRVEREIAWAELEIV
jgi:hypothetical protein